MEIDSKRLIIGLVLVFTLGVSFAIVNGFYVNSTNEQLPLIVYGIAFLSIIIGAGIVITFQWKINKFQMNKVLNLLPVDEKIVIKALFDNNNRLEQNKLVVLTGLNKVRMSRALSKMSQRDIIEKKQLGNTNLIILKI